MKLKEPKITISIRREGTEISIHDSESSKTFCIVKLTPEQLNLCLSQQGYVPCEVHLNGIETLGKKMEHKYLEFEVPKTLSHYDKNGKQQLEALCNAELLKQKMTEWKSDGYYNSQNSFYTDDTTGKKFARVTIRRYV